MNNDNKNLGDLIKSVWNRLSFLTKLYIVSGIAAFVGLLMVIVVIFSYNPFNFLNFSEGISNDNKEIDEAYDEYWGNFCSEDNDNCNEEQKEAAEKLKNSQERFYERLDKLEEKYLSKDIKTKKEQRFLILTTVFFGYGIDDLTMGNAFLLDESGNDEINEDVNQSNIYVQETDTLKELVKQFKVLAPVCYYDSMDANGHTFKTRSIITDDNDEPFVFNFFDKFRFNCGLYNEEKYQEAEKKKCTEVYGGKNPNVQIEEINDSDAVMNAFYKYLRESEYLDGKKHLESYFNDYAREKNIKEGIAGLSEDDKILVRQGIIDQIKKIVEEKMAEDEKAELFELAYGADTDYWWPIGSKETTTDGGKLFATGEPQYTHINSPFGGRGSEIHWGADLQADNNTNVIASRGGTVERVVTGCPPYTNSANCGFSWGNHVKILHEDGKSTLYAHLSSVKVSEGEKVQQGQVIGIAGNSGNSYGTHLHFEVYVNGVRVDPVHTDSYEGYVDPKNPRPQRLYEPLDYWWPIGSKKVTFSNGKSYAKDDPEILNIIQKYGNNGHNGIDIEAYKSSPYSVANVIASRGGEVVDVNKICESYTPDPNCGDTWGNYILIKDDAGRMQRYAHLERESITVNVGDKVEQGEVLSKAGNSGNSDAIHLHFEIYESTDMNSRTDPEKYIDIKKPRPKLLQSTTPAGGMKKLVAYMDCFEGSTPIVGNSYRVVNIGDGVRSVGHGITLENTASFFKKYNVNVSQYGVGSLIPIAIVDSVRTDVVKSKYDYVEKTTMDNNIMLSYEQKCALASFAYNWGSINNFVSVYKSNNGNPQAIKNQFFLASGNIGDCYGCRFYNGLYNRRTSESILYTERLWRCGGAELKFE